MQTLTADIYSEVHKQKNRDEMDDPLDYYTRAELKHYNYNFPSKESKAEMGAAN